MCYLKSWLLDEYCKVTEIIKMYNSGFSFFKPNNSQRSISKSLIQEIPIQPNFTPLLPNFTPLLPNFSLLQFK